MIFSSRPLLANELNRFFVNGVANTCYLYRGELFPRAIQRSGCSAVNILRTPGCIPWIFFEPEAIGMRRLLCIYNAALAHAHPFPSPLRRVLFYKTIVLLPHFQLQEISVCLRRTFTLTTTKTARHRTLKWVAR